MVADCPRSRLGVGSWDTRGVTTPPQPQPTVKPAKPRLLQDGRDMFWSIAPLVVACIILAGMVGMCTFAPGGTNRGPVPSYDAAGALRADAQTLGFPVRMPRLPEGWQPNSGSRGGIGDGRTDPSTGHRVRAVTSTVGYISPTGMYLSLTQSNADEDKLVGSIHPSMYPTGTVDVEPETHPDRVAAMLNNDRKECIGKRNARDLFTARREAGTDAEGAVLRHRRVALGDFIFRHPFQPAETLGSIAA